MSVLLGIPEFRRLSLGFPNSHTYRNLSRRRWILAGRRLKSTASVLKPVLASWMIFTWIYIYIYRTLARCQGIRIALRPTRAPFQPQRLASLRLTTQSIPINSANCYLRIDFIRIADQFGQKGIELSQYGLAGATRRSS
jgi:hypothetical protein